MPKISALPPGTQLAAADAFPFLSRASSVTERVSFDTLQSAVANAGVVQNLIAQASLLELSYVNVFDYMTPAQIADIQSGAATIDTLDAIRTAGAVAITTPGVKRALLFPFGSYKIRDTSGADSMFHWTGVNGITVISNDATFVVPQIFTAGQGFNLFYITNCTQVRQIGRINAIGSITKVGFLPPANVVATSPFTGIRIWYMEGSCQDIDIDALSETGGLNPINMFKDVNDPVTVIAKNIRIGSLKAKTCSYGINFQYTGENVVIEDLDVDDCYRGWFGYGVNNHTILNSRAKNCQFTDMFITGTDGYGSQNISFLNHLNLETDGTTTGALQGVVVDMAVGWGPTILAPCKMRNIYVRFRLNVPAANGNTYGVYIEKIDHTAADAPDPTDRGHIYENINISASIDNANVNFTPVSVFNTGTWGTGEFVRNFNIEDFRVSGTVPSVSQFYLTSLQGDAFVRNLNMGGEFRMKTSATGRITVVGSQATEFCLSNADTGNVTYINSNISVGAQQSFINKAFVNTMVGSVLHAFAADTGIFVSGTSPEAGFQAKILSPSSTVPLKLLRNDGGVSGNKLFLMQNGAGGGTSVFYGDTLGVFNAKSKLYPGTPANSLQSSTGWFAGIGVPSNNDGNVGDTFSRGDGGLGSNIYKKFASGAAFPLGSWTPLI